MSHPDRKKRIAAAISLGAVAFMLLIAWAVGRPIVRFVSDPAAFRSWVNAHGIWGRILFLVMQVVQVVIALIPGEPLELGAGYAFGAAEGTALCMLGTAVGSALVFGLVRRWGRPLAELFFTADKLNALPILKNPRRLNALVFLLFLIPGTPKDLLTWAVGLTPIRFGDYFWLTLVARVPSIVTSTVSGSALGEQKYLFAAVAFALTALISAAGLAIYHKLKG